MGSPVVAFLSSNILDILIVPAFVYRCRSTMKFIQFTNKQEFEDEKYLFPVESFASAFILGSKWEKDFFKDWNLYIIDYGSII